MEKNTQYVIYKKAGWETMGCCKPLEQFEKECEFLERKASNCVMIEAGLVRFHARQSASADHGVPKVHGC